MVVRNLKKSKNIKRLFVYFLVISSQFNSQLNCQDFFFKLLLSLQQYYKMSLDNKIFDYNKFITTNNYNV